MTESSGMIVRSSTVIADSLVLPEGPRWHENALWFVDMFGNRFFRWAIDSEAAPVVVAEIPGDLPSGSGFLPDGTPLLVLRRSRRVVRVTPSGLVVHADLSSIRSTTLNDMVVDGTGRAFVGSIVNRKIDDHGIECIVAVAPDGSYEIATQDVVAPNGMVVTPDGKRLIVAQTPDHTIVSFAIDDGRLTDRQPFGEFGSARPDGICADAEGAIWMGGVSSNEFVRVFPGGRVAERIPVGDRLALACMLGGPNRTTLYMATAATTIENVIENEARGSRGFIEAAQVDVPGAGWP
jgi:sugar lactone lactonase YvrE